MRRCGIQQDVQQEARSAATQRAGEAALFGVIWPAAGAAQHRAV